MKAISLLFKIALILVSCFNIYSLYSIDPLILQYDLFILMDDLGWYILLTIGIMLCLLFSWQINTRQYSSTVSKAIRIVTQSTFCFWVPLVITYIYLSVIAYSYAENIDVLFDTPLALAFEYSQRLLGFLFVTILDIITAPGRIIVGGIMKTDGTVFGIPIRDFPWVAYPVYMAVNAFLAFTIRPFLKPHIGDLKSKLWKMIKTFFGYRKKLKEIYYYRSSSIKPLG